MLFCARGDRQVKVNSVETLCIVNLLEVFTIKAFDKKGSKYSGSALPFPVSVIPKSRGTSIKLRSDLGGKMA